MQLGYLTNEGHLVVVDTLGNRSLFKAYRIDAPHGMRYLTVWIPFEHLGGVSFSVDLHRKGWGKPGENVVRRTPANLYRTRTGHVLIGPTWKSLRMPRWGPAADVSYPYPWLFDPIRKISGINVPPAGSPSIVFIPDVSVKACRQEGARVEVFGTERKEFTEFVLGKIRVVMDFPDVGRAKEFASNFSRVDEPRSADPGVEPDIDRNKRLIWSRSLILKISPFTLVLAGEIALLAISIAFLGAPNAIRLGAVLGGTLIGTFLYLPSHVREFRTELVAYRSKWPRTLLDRWASGAGGHAQMFLHELQDLGVPLDAGTGGLEPLDRYLRLLPPEAVFGSFAWGAAAVVGAHFVANLGKHVPFRWEYSEEHQAPVLKFEGLEFLVSPFTRVIRTWKRKEPITLDAFVAQYSDDVLRYSAFRHQLEFIAFGFVDKGWDEGWEDFDAFEAEFKEGLESASLSSAVLGENHYRTRIVESGPFQIRYIEIEVERPNGVRFLPLIAVPFCTEAQAVRAVVDPRAPPGTPREDVLAVRLRGYEIVPVGVELANYLETAQRPPASGEEVELRLIAVADAIQIANPRARSQRRDIADAIAPIGVGEGEPPTSPYVSVVGRISSVEGLVNPLRSVPFWRLRVEVPGFVLEVLVRKDRCDGVPEVGQYALGSVWLLADLVSGTPVPPGYIR